MQHDLAPCQHDGTRRQRHAHQKVQSFRDHAYDRSDHSHDAVAEAVALRHITLNEQRDADRNDHDARRDDDPVDRAHHLRLLPCRHLARLEHEL